MADGNCVEIMAPFMDSVARSEISFQVIGGVGSAALNDRLTMIIPEGRRIIAPSDLVVPQHRPDGNLRDLDALVLDTDPEKIAEVEETARAEIGSKLELAMFGLHGILDLCNRFAKPLGFSDLSMMLSDRYMSDSGHFKALTPFAAEFSDDFLDTWALQIGRTETPIPHPGATLLNYYTRSISGLRHTDTEKVLDMGRKIAERAPQVLDWMFDGPGMSHVELARALHALREPRRDPSPLVIAGRKIKTDDYRDLVESELFLPVNLSGNQISDRQKAIILAVARVKARTLHGLESNDKLVTLWQRYGEQRAGKLVTN